jgi:CRISPR-associated protein Csc3
MSDDLDFLEDDGFGFEEEADRSLPTVKRELLTLKLLRNAIQSQHPNDAVLRRICITKSAALGDRGNSQRR